MLLATPSDIDVAIYIDVDIEVKELTIRTYQLDIELTIRYRSCNI